MNLWKRQNHDTQIIHQKTIDKKDSFRDGPPHHHVETSRVDCRRFRREWRIEELQYDKAILRPACHCNRRCTLPTVRNVGNEGF
jgi:hypothetical protein